MVRRPPAAARGYPVPSIIWHGTAVSNRALATLAENTREGRSPRADIRAISAVLDSLRAPRGTMTWCLLRRSTST